MIRRMHRTNYESNEALRNLGSSILRCHYSFVNWSRLGIAFLNPTVVQTAPVAAEV